MFRFQKIITKWISNINIIELSHNSLVCRYLTKLEHYTIYINIILDYHPSYNHNLILLYNILTIKTLK
jgi:hypothetical protein